MKKLLILLLALASCSKNNPEPTNPTTEEINQQFIVHYGEVIFNGPKETGILFVKIGNKEKATIKPGTDPLDCQEDGWAKFSAPIGSVREYTAHGYSTGVWTGTVSFDQDCKVFDLH